MHYKIFISFPVHYENWCPKNDSLMILRMEKQSSPCIRASKCLSTAQDTDKDDRVHDPHCSYNSVISGPCQGYVSGKLNMGLSH